MNLPQVKGRLEKDYPLQKLNTWKIGGQAEMVFWPENSHELLTVYKWCLENSIRATLLGYGSNVLLPDEGLRGMVIISTGVDSLYWNGNKVQVGAGFSLVRLANKAAEKGLRGLEFACGIPGTVGGAIAINAGAHGYEIGSLVESIQVVSPEGNTLVLDGKDIEFSYRDSSLARNGHWILEATLVLQAGGDSTEIKEKMKALRNRRKQTQPLEYPNAGSVFRNPPGDSAGRLIEEAGWKGYRVGGAEVSEKHANFIVNVGNAKAKDILELIRLIKLDIKAKYGIELEREIKVINSE